jgi:chaperone modulatory protein CbpM
MARIERLRTGLSLNYAALGLVIELLDRITELEGALRRQRRADPGRNDAGRSA